jgi:hypothetical protein
MPVNAVRSCRVPDIHADVINMALARRTRDAETAGCLAKKDRQHIRDLIDRGTAEL